VGQAAWQYPLCSPFPPFHQPSRRRASSTASVERVGRKRGDWAPRDLPQAGRGPGGLTEPTMIRVSGNNYSREPHGLCDLSCHADKGGRLRIAVMPPCRSSPRTSYPGSENLADRNPCAQLYELRNDRRSPKAWSVVPTLGNCDHHPRISQWTSRSANHQGERALLVRRREEAPAERRR